MNSSEKFIPVNEPLLNGNEKKYINECIDTGWISSEGKFITEFENKFASYVGRKFGVACANGSAALDIAIASLELNQGDEVILPSFTIISPAFSLIRAGLLPVLVDSDLSSWNMDVSKIEEKITSKTKAILVVHIYGLPVDINPVIELCKKYNLLLIEDAAEMHGQTYFGRKCGSFGDISIVSFYPNKHITTGEGGMVLTDNSKLADRAKKLRNLAFEPNYPRFVHFEMGWNYRMTNMQAAVGLAQLEKIEEHIVRKREIAKLYNEYFRNLEGIVLPPEKTTYAENIYWVYGILLDKKHGINAKKMMELLADEKVGTRPFFFPMHKQPVFNKMNLFIHENLPNSEYLAEYGFYIPSGLKLTNEEIKIVIDRFNKVYKRLTE